MNRIEFRGSLLTTSSALALLVGVGGSAWAQCQVNNASPPINNSGSINCISFNNEQDGTPNGNFAGATTFTGNVVNTGTITPTGVNANFPTGKAGTDAGISVLGPGVNLIGSITNSGTITGTNQQSAGINIGGGGGGSGAPGSTVTGSIINAAVISGIQSGIVVNGHGTVVTGSVINQTGASIINSSTAGGPGIQVTNGASVGGSLINNGTINTGGSGLLLEGSTVTGNVSNGGMISMHNGFTAMALVDGGEGPGKIGGSVINTGTIINGNATSNIALWLEGQSVAGGVTNTGSITGGTGIYISAFSNAVGGIVGTNVSNNGSIVAHSFSGVAIAGASVGGAVINSGSITAPVDPGIVVEGTSAAPALMGSVGGGITNSGSIVAQTGILVTGSGIVSGGITNTGMISASGTGIMLLTPGMSVFDSGTIIGSGGTAIQFASGATNTMTLGAGWSITGTVAGAGSDILDLGGSGPGAGTFNLALLDTQFTGFTTFNTVSGIWDLTGSNAAFTGTLTISGGDLAVGTAASPNTTYGGSIVVDPGGTLSGHGTILGGVANDGGTVMAGGSIGTLTIGGNFTQSASGTFIAQLTPSAASLLAVGGSATLAGTLEAAPAAGSYPLDAKFPIITAGGGVIGTFSTFINEMPSLALTVDYLPNEVELVTGGVNFVSAQTGNQSAVATALNLASVGATGDFATELETIVALPSSQQQQAFASLGGQIYANLGEVSLQDRQLFLGAMDERMENFGFSDLPGVGTMGGLVPGGWGGGATATQFAMLSSAISGQQSGSDPMNPPTEAQIAQAAAAPQEGSTYGLPNNVWARGFGQFGSLDNDRGALGADYSTGGGAIGLDVIRTPQTILGFAAGGGQSTLSTNSLPENGTISFVQLGAYGAQQIGGGFALDGAVIYAHDFYDVSRGLVGLGRTATSSHGGDDAVVDLGLRRPFAYDGWQVTPRAGFTYYHIDQSQFSESGASSVDLLVNPAAIDALRSRVGLTVSQPMLWGGNQVVPELRAAWTHDFVDDHGATLAALVGAPAVLFQEAGAVTGRDAAELGAGLNFAIAQATVPGHLSAFVEYDATVAAHLTNNAFAGGLKLTW